MSDDLLSIRLKAIADPTRRAILDLLAQEGARRAGDIAHNFPDITRPGVSKHLRVLREAGLIRETDSPDARMRVYIIEVEALNIVRQWMDRYAIYWQERLDDLERLATENDK
jgi:DNA-binding transcriptional ArsR family regulator